jgi:hypothetical protein
MNMGRRQSRGYVSGDGSAKVRFRTLSGDCNVTGGRETAEPDEDEWDGKHHHQGRHERSLERRIERRVARMARGMGPDFDFPTPPARPPTPPMPPSAPGPSGYGYRTQSATTASQSRPQSQLEILQALERGEIDVDEATRRLQEA